jgi:tetratricopeptide (TPR) repeat protein
MPGKTLTATLSGGMQQSTQLRWWILWLVLVTCLPSDLLGRAQSLRNSSPPAGQVQSLQEQADRAYQRGMYLLNNGRYQEALDEFQQLAKLAPHLPQGPTGEGIAFALLGKPSEAIDELKKALILAPSFWVARRELGILYWHQNLHNLAAKELVPLAQMFPDDTTINLILGQYYFEQERYFQALECFSKAPAQVTRQPDLAMMQARAYLKTGEGGQAARILEQLTLRPGLPKELRFQLAWLLGEVKNYRAAINVFESLPPDYPDALRRNYGLALAYYDDGRYVNCIRILNHAHDQRKLSPAAYSLLGAAEEKNGQTKQAYDTFRQGILSFPKNPENYMNIATLAAQHFNYDLAVQLLTLGIERIPQSYGLYLSRGIAYTLKANFSDAQKDFARAIRVNPHDAQAYYSLGLCLLEKGELKESVQAFTEAVAREPKDALPYFFIAEASIQDGVTPRTPDFSKAQKALDTAISFYPDFAYAYRDRAQLELRAGKSDQALSDLERAHALAPHSNSISYLLAQTYQRSGDRAKATKLFAAVEANSEKETKTFRRHSLTQALVVISKSPQ